ncbi:MAG: ribosome recycling factor, partial [Chloroflexi bacterium RBG_16_57_9]
MVDDVLKETKDRMQKSIDALRYDLSTIRTGRASPALVERLMVDYYGTPTPLQQLSAIAVPEARLLTIKPFDPSALSTIERAILKSDLGLTPNNDGKIIRLSIPQLTEERRRELVKVAARRVEEGRVAVRNSRRDGLRDLQEIEKEGLITEDDLHYGREEMQKLTDK